MDNIDDLMTNLEERERAEKRVDPDRSDALDIAGSVDDQHASDRVLVGMVDHFYDRINVAAIKLTGRIRVGDVIEIKNADETVRLRVSSMQINKEDVESAGEGDDVGIKVEGRVSAGSRVYVVT